MKSQIYSFGEILWDCLPTGKHAGGAPFNVTAHLAQLGASASLISAVGQDTLGHEILEVARHKNVGTRFVSRLPDLPTGTVQVTVDAKGNATYDIVQPVAWDHIEVSDEAVEAVSSAAAFIYGSLACRLPYNLGQSNRLLSLKGPMKFFDVNLRPPYANPELVVERAQHADVIKLNDDEVGRLASWLKTGEMKPSVPRTSEALHAACSALAEASDTPIICVTRGEAGAALWNRGRLHCAPAPKVTVKDTVGAGDAFMAGLIMGVCQGMEIDAVLENACRVGAYVASHHGATPLLPDEIIQEFRTGLSTG